MNANNSISILVALLLVIGTSDTLAKKKKPPFDDTSPLSATESQYVHFGVIPVTARNCTMSANGSLSGDCVGSGLVGEMEIQGEPYYAYAVSVSSQGWIKDARFIPALPNQSYMLDGLGRSRVSIVGQFQLKPNRTHVGVLNTTYTFTVYYQ